MRSTKRCWRATSRRRSTRRWTRRCAPTWRGANGKSPRKRATERLLRVRHERKRPGIVLHVRGVRDDHAGLVDPDVQLVGGRLQVPQPRLVAEQVKLDLVR